EIVEESEEGRPSSPSAEASGKPASSVSVLPRVVSQPAVWAIASMYFFLKMTRYSFLFWLPLYMTEEFGYSVSEAGYTSALYELVGFSGAILAGYASDKLARSRRFPVGTVMLLGLALVCFLHPVMTAAGGLGLAVWIVLVGIMTYGPDTLMSGAAAQDLGSPAGSATTAGLINGVGSVGQLCSPLLVAFVSDRYGWNALFYLFVLIALLGAALLATQWSYQPDRRLMEKTDGVRA
ncbi:MAG: MFS transporter, partial [Acidobacteriota bacterium]